MNHSITGQLLLRTGGSKSRPTPAAGVESAVPKKRKALLCRQCLQVITSKADKTEIGGAFQHAFANPHGLVFQIGCFKKAIGGLNTGTPSEEWTWFPGYAWQITLCQGCLIHLGWFFSGGAEDNFYGLILERLTEPDKE